MNDPIADLLVRIQNAGMAGKDKAVMPYSKMKHGIASLLEKEGFTASVEKKGKKAQRQLEIGVLFIGKKPRIRGFRRISKLSRRLYVKVDEIQPIKNGYGRVFISTSHGVMTGDMARKEGVGGEVLFSIW
jgi:small subunit ribosomal protein S8